MKAVKYLTDGGVRDCKNGDMVEAEFLSVSQKEIDGADKLLIEVNKNELGKICGQFAGTGWYSIVAIIPKKEEEKSKYTNLDDYLDIAQLDKRARAFMERTCRECCYRIQESNDTKELRKLIMEFNQTHIDLNVKLINMMTKKEDVC